MKISICSDMHLEFGGFDLHNTDNADVLILSGDILLAEALTPKSGASAHMVSMANDFGKFVEAASNQFPIVLYICGNHEHYHGDITTTHTKLFEYLDDLDNFHLLENSFLDYEDVRFFGATLWTDMNRNNPLTMGYLEGYMNDFSIIKNSDKGRHFSPEDAYNLHIESVAKMRTALEGINKAVVLTHHAPSKQSTHPRYKMGHGAEHVNGGYSSNLDNFILDHPQIVLWTHGHTHEAFDYNIGNTRIVANPRGYIGSEAIADEFKLKTVEI